MSTRLTWGRTPHPTEPGRGLTIARWAGDDASPAGALLARRWIHLVPGKGAEARVQGEAAVAAGDALLVCPGGETWRVLGWAAEGGLRLAEVAVPWRDVDAPDALWRTLAGKALLHYLGADPSGGKPAILTAWEQAWAALEWLAKDSGTAALAAGVPGHASAEEARRALAKFRRIFASAPQARVFEAQGALDLVEEIALDTPEQLPDWPVRWPFAVCLLGWGGTIYRGQVLSYGVLATENGDLLEIVQDKQGKTLPYPLRIAGVGWVADDAPIAWVVARVIERIVEGRTRALALPAPSFADRRKHPRGHPRLVREFYRVPINNRAPPPPEPPPPPDDAPQLDAEGSAAARQYAHRWEVRGHERVHIRSGVGEIDPRYARDLTRRGYRIHPAGADLPPEDRHRLAARGVEVAAGDWIALLPVWVRPHHAGPESAPEPTAVRGVKV